MYYKQNCSWLSCLSYLQDTESDCPVSVLIKGLERPCRGKVNGKWSVQGQELNNCSTPEPQLWLQFNTAGSWEHIKQTACSIKNRELVLCMCDLYWYRIYIFKKSQLSHRYNFYIYAALCSGFLATVFILVYCKMLVFGVCRFKSNDLIISFILPTQVSVMWVSNEQLLLWPHKM